MSLILSGTDGLSDIDGSAATPAIRGTDANTGIFFPAADTIAFAEGGAEVMRIDSSGNVGIGTSSPAAKLQVTVAPASGADNGMRVTDGTRIIQTNITGSAYSYIGIGANETMLYSAGNPLNIVSDGQPIKFIAGTAERARIDTSGNLLVGTTSGGSYSSSRVTLSTNAGTTNWNVGPYSTATNFLISNGSGGVVLAGAATSWSALSDERLKTALKPIENATDKVASLRVGTGRYLSDDESVSRVFLIAQDVQTVLPEAVDVGEDEQQTLMLRYTDLIPLLTKAIQEQQASIVAQSELIESLTARVAALEGTQA